MCGMKPTHLGGTNVRCMKHVRLCRAAAASIVQRTSNARTCEHTMQSLFRRDPRDQLEEFERREFPVAASPRLYCQSSSLITGPLTLGANGEDI